jgi:hypothetical protein
LRDSVEVVGKCVVAHANHSGTDDQTTNVLESNLRQRNLGMFKENIRYAAAIDRMSAERSIDLFEIMNEIRRGILAGACIGDEWLKKRRISGFGVADLNRLQPTFCLWAPKTAFISDSVMLEGNVATIIVEAQRSVNAAISFENDTLNNASLCLALNLQRPVICSQVTIDSLCKVLSVSSFRVSSEVKLVERLVMETRREGLALARSQIEDRSMRLPNGKNVKMYALRNLNDESMCLKHVPFANATQLTLILSILRRQLVFNQLVRSLFDAHFDCPDLNHSAQVEIVGDAANMALQIKINQQSYLVGVSEDATITVTFNDERDEKLSLCLQTCECIPLFLGLIF